LLGHQATPGLHVTNRQFHVAAPLAQKMQKSLVLSYEKLQMVIEKKMFLQHRRSLPGVNSFNAKASKGDQKNTRPLSAGMVERGLIQKEVACCSRNGICAWRKAQ